MALFALSLLGLSVPVLAAAAWTTPIGLSPGGGRDPQVAMDADGDAVFTWIAPAQRAIGQVEARTRSADGTLGAVQILSDLEDVGDLQVALDADGDAVFVWQVWDGTDYRIQARTRSADGTLSAVQTLSKGGQQARLPQVAVDADGDALVTWYADYGSNWRIQSRALSAAGTLGRVENLSDPGESHPGGPQVAVDADGDALVTWWGSHGVRARARSADGTWGEVQTLDPAGSRARVAMNADGDAVFTWQRKDRGGFRIQTQARSADGTLSAVQPVSNRGLNSFDAEVAIDAEGDAVFAWVQFDRVDCQVTYVGCKGRQIVARARSAAGTLSGLQALSRNGRDARDPRVAVDADGDAVFTWQRFDGVNDRVEARSRSADGTLGPITTLSDPVVDGGGQQVAIDADGDALVTWHNYDGTGGYRVEASAGP